MLDEQLESPFGLINDHNLDSSNYNSTAFDHTKILDTESENLYDLDIEPTYSWLPFLIGIVGFIHVKYFHKL